MEDALRQLRERLAQIRNLSKAAAVLSWDQKTYMPVGGTRARAEQLTTLSRISHTWFTAPETGELLRAAAEEVRALPYDGDDASLVRVTQRDYDRATRLPVSLVAAMTRHRALAQEVWVKARQSNDFATFAPCLEQAVEDNRQVADHFGYEEHPYDALLDQFEPGMKTGEVTTIFRDLRQDLVPLAQALAGRSDRVNDSVLHQPFDEVQQERFARTVVAALGYDFNRGRLDRTVHPFATSFSRNDVRITTRYQPNFLSAALFGTMHESGHGMYEQGVAAPLDDTPLGRGASSMVHESQSRLWENVVGRGRPFWQHFYPHLQETFPAQLDGVDLDTFYRAINRIQPSHIRVEADEVTYSLHIMIRFELELDLIEGNLAVQDAPAAWGLKMQEYLGIVPPTDTLGILQDTHWASGMFGYFPTYALGNILSLQLFEIALAERPSIPEEISRGEFTGLHGWLTEKVYRHGRKFRPQELVERVTGSTLHAGPYVSYLRHKFGEIYGL